MGELEWLLSNITNYLQSIQFEATNFIWLPNFRTRLYWLPYLSSLSSNGFFFFFSIKFRRERRRKNINPLFGRSERVLRKLMLLEIVSLNLPHAVCLLPLLSSLVLTFLWRLLSLFAPSALCSDSFLTGLTWHCILLVFCIHNGSFLQCFPKQCW